MNRSQVNLIMRQAEDFLAERRFVLPPFAYWSPAEWAGKGHAVRQVAACRLGWDITDFGQGDFARRGLFLFTIRNGDLSPAAPLPRKTYAEKILIVEEGQLTPLHFHWSKMEDIINRGGGKLLIQLYNSTPAETLDELGEVLVSIDGVERKIPAGGVVTLSPGESISLPQYCYHQFWAGEGRALVGEVSMVNDDNQDNRFLQPLPRFPPIEEDESPWHLLVNDYPNYYSY
jgi:D-lyxose ketol-isomerase